MKAGMLIALPGGKGVPSVLLPLTPDTEAALWWCFLREPDAWPRFVDWIEPEHLSPPAATLLQQAKLRAASNGALPSRVALTQLVRMQVDEGKLTMAQFDAACDVLDRGDDLRDAGSFTPAEVYEQVGAALRKAHAGSTVVDSIPKLVHGDPTKLAEVAAHLTALTGIGSGAFDPGLQFDTLVAIGTAALVGTKAGHMPTGVAALDSAMGGGLRRGDLGTLHGGTNTGKSQGLSQFTAEALNHGRNAVYVSLEMPPLDVYVRVHGALLDREITPYQQRLDSDEQSERILALHELHNEVQKHLGKYKCGSLTIKYFKGSTPLSHIRAFLAAHARKQRLDLVSIDYGDLILKPKTRENEADHLSITQLWRAMRDDIAIGMDCALWTASQAQRGSRKKLIVDEEAVADGMGKMRESDVGVGICQTTEEATQGVVRLYVAKLRNREAHQLLGPYPVGYGYGRLVGTAGDGL